ncbi:YybH family protein [Edaphobacter aggregans]|uniref:YybH family protein n=1 Tax=Edaphobacter aggregans TaxID=570835 RepID=UPI000550F4FE|nr:SgcJ/EcaC family oxidoreductase [Edaphobacter aggregans]
MSVAVAAHEDEQRIRELVDAWGQASCTGDLAAQLNMVTDDVVFLTAGSVPMRREEFAERYRSMIEQVKLEVRSSPREITVTGDVAVLWNLLEVSITPLAGGETMKRAGNTLTVLRRGDDGQWRIWRDANMLAPA